MSVLRETLRNNRIIYSIYHFLYGQFKERRVIKERKAALQTEGFSYLQSIDAALKETGITYFVAFGSLLGIIRENGFIKHDCDMDFGVLKDEHFSWKLLDKSLKDYGFEIVHGYKYNGEYKQLTYSKGILTVDFFLFDLEGQNSIASYVCYKDSSVRYSDIYESSIGKISAHRFENIEQIQYKNITLNVPNNYTTMLSDIYGTNWMIPDPTWSHVNGPSWTSMPSSAYCVEEINDL